MTQEKFVMIGNGMAGIRAIEEILKTDPGKFSIPVFGKEPHPVIRRVTGRNNVRRNHPE